MQEFNSQVAVLQSRLLETLDTLDAIQAAHAEELAVSRRAQEALKLKLDVYCKTVREAEAERDDMRHAVLSLVEKVEKENNAKKWPYAQIQLSSHPGPASMSSSSSKPPSAEKYHDDAIGYAASLLEAVRRERDAEHKAHIETRAQAEACILALEAKLHRRETELMGASTSSTDAEYPREAAPGSTTPRAAGSRISPQKASANKATILGNGAGSRVEQIAAALDETMVLNKRLECEISQLRLEKARSAHSDRDRELIDNDRYYEHAKDIPLTPLRKPKKVPLHRVVQVHDEAQPQHSPRLVSSTASSNATVTMTPTLTRVTKHDHERDVELLHGLEAQIGLLGKKIDAFARERGALADVVVSSKAQKRHTHKPRRGPILQRGLRIDSSESDLDSEQSTPTHGSRGTRSFRDSRVISPPPSPTPSTKRNQLPHNFELHAKHDPPSSSLRTTKPDSRRSAVSSSRSSLLSPAPTYPQSSTSARLDVHVYAHAVDPLPQEQPQPQTPKTAKRGARTSPTTQMRASTSTIANGQPATGINSTPVARLLVQRGVQTELDVHRAAEEVHKEDRAVQTAVDPGDHERNEDRVEDRTSGHVDGDDGDDEPRDHAHDDGATNASVKPDLPASPQTGGEQTPGGKVDVVYVYSAGHTFGRTMSLDAVGSAVETGISGSATGVTRSASTGAIWTETLSIQTPTTPRGRSMRGVHTSGSVTRRKERATRRAGVSAPPRSLDTLNATPLRSHPFTAGSPHQATAFSSRAFASFGGLVEVGDRHRDKRVRTDRAEEALEALVYEASGDKVGEERKSIVDQGRTSDEHDGTVQEQQDIVDPGHEQHDGWRAYEHEHEHEHEHESRGEEEGEMPMELESEKAQSIVADNEGEQSMELATPLMGVCDIPDEDELDENADAGLTSVGAWATDGGGGESEYLEEHDLREPAYELVENEADSDPKEALQVSEAPHDNWYGTRQKDKPYAQGDVEVDNTNKHASVRSSSPHSPASSSASTSPTLAPQPPAAFLALAQPLAHRPLTGAHAFPYLHPFPPQAQRTVSAPAPALAITIPRPASGQACTLASRRLHDSSKDAHTYAVEIAQDAHKQSSPVAASASARGSTRTPPEGHPQPSGKANSRTPAPIRTRTPSRTQSRTPLIGTPSRTGTPLLIGTPLIGTPLIGTPLTPSRSLYQATSSFVAELRQVDMMLAAAAAREQEQDRS